MKAQPIRLAFLGAPEDTLAEQIVGDIDLAICIFAGLPTRVKILGASPEAFDIRSEASFGELNPIKRKPAYLQIHFGFAHGGMAVLDFARTITSSRKTSPGPSTPTGIPS